VSNKNAHNLSLFLSFLSFSFFSPLKHPVKPNENRFGCPIWGRLRQYQIQTQIVQSAYQYFRLLLDGRQVTSLTNCQG
jgi:hypothetical protein